MNLLSELIAMVKEAFGDEPELSQEEKRKATLEQRKRENYEKLRERYHKDELK